MARKVGPLTNKILLCCHSGKSSGASGRAALPTSDPICHSAREEASCSKCDKLTDEKPPFCTWMKAEVPPGLADDPDCEGFAPLGTSKGKERTVGYPTVEKAKEKRVDKLVSKASKTACPKSDSSSIQAALKFKGAGGSVVMERICCGKPCCHCHTGALHGPYPYLHYYSNGKIKRHYLSKAVSALLSHSTEELEKMLHETGSENSVTEPAKALLGQERKDSHA